MTYDAAPDPSARQGRKTVNESQDTPLSEGSWQPFLTVNACGRDWTLERAADMEALWESMTEFTEDERLPYWTELWPSSPVSYTHLQHGPGPYVPARNGRGAAARS